MALFIGVGCGPTAPGPIVIGARSHPASRILGEAVARTLELGGMPCKRRFDLLGPRSVHEALRTGEIDVGIDSPGLALVEVLGLPRGRDEDETRQKAESEYRRLGLVWLPAFGFDDPEVVVVRSERAAELEIDRLSQLGMHSLRLILATPYGWARRLQGLAAFRRAYGVGFQEVREMPVRDLYPALARRQVDLVVGRASDPALADPSLVVLADDLRWFAGDRPAPVAREELLRARPELRRALATWHGRLTIDRVRAAAASVGRGVPARQVVRDLLR